MTGEKSEAMPVLVTRKEATLKWKESTEGLSPAQVVGAFIIEGAKVVNYQQGLEGPLSKWEPEVDRDGDDMLVTVVNVEGAAIYYGDVLSIGLDRALKARASKTLRNEDLVMVPYPRFARDGQIDGSRSHVLVMTAGQAEELRVAMMAKGETKDQT